VLRESAPEKQAEERVHALKSQIPNPKLQTNPKISKAKNSATTFGIFACLKFAWDLELGI
jgi:hypothetical protein